ncbi:Peroxidasin [Stylophora pistillata]|uniref:Peroxidasin n=1 Tax=Stylophora pistillata TaxID=50429 RepID=A0A2B4RJ89_STYPI|nr:Peroxidasin [Stylophora pistillata]
MDALSQVNAVVDVIQGTLPVNGETGDCIDHDSQPLSCRYLVRRMTVVPPNSEVIINGHLRHRKQSYCHETSNLRILEPSNNPHLLGKGLCIARTLVDIEISNTVPIRVLILTDEPQTIKANTTIAIAKPVQSVWVFDSSDNCNDDSISTDCDAQGDLPEPLSTKCQEAFERLKELLTSSPILAYPQGDAPLILDTDVSNHVGPEITQFTTSAVHHKVCQYGVIIFNCAADACPPVTSYQLFENDIAVLDTNTSGMWSRNMSTRGVFMYKCVANNTYGTGISETIPVRVYVPPSIQEIDNLTITEGSDMTLTCQISGDPPLEQFWIKPDGQRATTNVLTIKNITNGEAGEYRCEATNDCGTVSRTACVDVQSKLDKNFWPKCNCTSLVMDARPFLLKYIYDSKAPYEEVKPENVTLKTNTTNNYGCSVMGVKFTCHSSEANPPVHNYILIKNNSEVSFSKEGTWMERISREETFVYKCVACQQVGNVTSRNNITLTVGGPPAMEQVQNATVIEDKPAATYSSATIRLKSGEDGSIDCPVDIGNPPAVITWYKGNHTNCNKIATNSTLKVQNASSSDEGRYTCFAKNALGNTTISLLLLVVKPVSSTVSTPFQTTPAGPEEYNCRSNNVLFALIGVLAFIILLLVIYIIWLHRKGAVGKQRTYEDERGVYDVSYN